MADYTFSKLIEISKNDSAIQTILDIDSLAAPAKTALTGYVASLGLSASDTQHLLWESVGVAVLIQQLSLIYYLPSLGTQTPAPALKRTSTLADKVVEMQSLESKFPKCQMMIFGKNPENANWIWLNTEVIQNSGNRVNTLKLVPYISQSDSFVPGRGTKIGIQFIADPVSNATLPQAGDRLTVSTSVYLDVNPMGSDSKKNNEVDSQLVGRLAALEALIQPFGAATGLVGGTNGLVAGAAAGQSDFLLRGDRTWQNPAAFVRMVGQQLIEGIKTFVETITGNKFVRSVGAGDLSQLYTQSQAVLFSVGAGGGLALVSAPSPLGKKIVDFFIDASGNFNVRRVNDNYTSSTTLLQYDADNNLKLNNFTNFGGNVSIKAFLVTGTLPPSQGGILNVSLGIDSGKVVGTFPFVQFDANGRMPPGFKQLAGYEYESYIDENVVIFRLSSANSYGIVGKPCSCLVLYTN